MKTKISRSKRSRVHKGKVHKRSMISEFVHHPFTSIKDFTKRSVQKVRSTVFPTKAERKGRKISKTRRMHEKQKLYNKLSKYNKPFWR